jgi:hypothetical protein
MEVPFITAAAVLLEMPHEVIPTPGAKKSRTASVRFIDRPFIGKKD